MIGTKNRVGSAKVLELRDELLNSVSEAYSAVANAGSQVRFHSKQPSPPPSVWRHAVLALVLAFTFSTAEAQELQVLVQTGEQAPGQTAGTEFTDLGYPTINASGHIAFQAEFQSPGGPFVDGIWAGTPPAVAPIVLQGEPAPGADETEVFCNFEFLNPILRPIVAENNTIAFRARLGTAGSCSGREGIWVYTGSEIELLALEGECSRNDA